MRRILWLCWLAFLAWFFSSVLEVLVPLPTESMVDGILNLSIKADRAVFILLRYVVWMFLIHAIIKFTRPFLEFALPTAKRYAVTKPFRRIQGVVTEFGLLGVIFALTSIILVMPFGMKKSYDRELSFQEENFSKTLDTLLTAREYYRQNLIDVSAEGNQWLIEQLIYENARRASLNNPFYLVSGDYFLVPHKTEKKLSKQGSGTMWLYVSDYYYPTEDRPDLTLNNYHDVQTSFLAKGEYKRAKKISLIDKIEGQASFQRTRYYSLKQKYNQARNLYYEQAKQIMLKLHIKDAEGIDFFVKTSGDSQELTDDAKRLVWASFRSTPFQFISSSLKEYWLVSLIIAFVLYGFSHTSVRYKIAPFYESVLRFFEQGRFGLGGSSRFAGIIEEWATLYKNQKEGIFLGRSLFNKFLTIGIEDKRHMLTVAATRAGKGTTAIIPNLLLWQGSTIVIDPKGTNAIVTARRRREMGQNVHIVDPFNIIGEKETAQFNPLAGLDPKSETIREDINMITEALVVPDPEQKERHWDDGAKTIIAGIIGHIVSSGKYDNPTLSEIREILGSDPETQKETWLDMMLNEGAGRLPKDAGARVMRGYSTGEISSIISNADKHTEWLSAPTMKKTLSSSTFDFAEMKEKPTTIYLILPPNKLVTYNRFLRLFINMALNEISNGGRSKVPILMIMDEFLALGRMEEVEKAFGLLAGYNLVMWPIVQEIGKLKDIYGSSFNAFINNSRGIQVFGVQGETSEFVSDLLGERRTAGMTKKEKWDRAAKLRAPNEVAIDVAVEAGWQYVLRSGKAPLVLEKIPYYQHEMFSGMYDQDPDYA